VTATAEHANAIGRLATGDVGEGGVQLVHQIDRRCVNRCADTGVGDSLQAQKRLAAAGGQDDGTLTVVITPRFEGGLLVVSGLDLECGCQCEVGNGASRIVDGTNEAITQRRLVVAVGPVTDLLTEFPIAIGFGAIFPDAVVPLDVRNSARCIANKEVALVEFEPHSGVYRCPIAVNLWIGNWF
jgi:hypothetical protein